MATKTTVVDEPRPRSVVGTNKRTTVTTQGAEIVEEKVEVKTHGLKRPTTRETKKTAPRAGVSPDETATEKISKGRMTSTYSVTVIGTNKKCATCGEILATSDYIEAAGKKYHSSGNCFCCSKCGVKLNFHRFFVKMSSGILQPFCEKCLKSAK